MSRAHQSNISDTIQYFDGTYVRLENRIVLQPGKKVPHGIEIDCQDVIIYKDFFVNFFGNAKDGYAFKVKGWSK